MHVVANFDDMICRSTVGLSDLSRHQLSSTPLPLLRWVLPSEPSSSTHRQALRHETALTMAEISLLLGSALAVIIGQSFLYGIVCFYLAFALDDLTSRLSGVFIVFFVICVYALVSLPPTPHTRRRRVPLNLALLLVSIFLCLLVTAVSAQENINYHSLQHLTTFQALYN